MTHFYFKPSRMACFLFALLLGSATLSAQGKIIWTDLSGKISRANTDGTEVQTFLTRQIPHDMLADIATQTIYWSEYGSNSIWRVALSGGQPERVYQAGGRTRGLALYQQKLYVAVPQAILKMNLNGTQVETALVANNVNDLVVVNGEIYWTDIVDGKIWKQNATGTGGTTLFSSLSSPYNIQYNSSDSKLYWAEYCGASTCTGVRKGNLNGTGKTVVIDEFIAGFDFNEDGTKVFCTYNIFDEIFSINTNGTGRTTVASITSSPTDLLLIGNRQLWFDLSYGDYLYSAFSDGSDQVVLVSSPVYNPTRFAVDTVYKWIYWINSPGGFSNDNSQAINKARLDGTEVQSVVPKSELDEPYGLALDLVHEKLYWTDPSEDGIRRSNLDGTQVETIVFTGFTEPTDLLLDIPNNRIFWTEWSAGKIMRADLNGNDPTPVLENLDTPWGLAYDPVEENLYWTDIGSTKRILRVSANGGDVDTIVTLPTVFERPNGIWIDAAERLLYWSDESRNSIYRSDLEGTDVDTILVAANGVDRPAGVQVFGAGSIVPVKTPEVASTVIRAYPNPFTGDFVIDHVRSGDRITLYDVYGKMVLAQTVRNNGLFQIKCESLTDGFYFLSVQRSTGTSETVKMLKKSH